MNTKLDNGAADINILAPENLSNPYPMFQKLIADAPVLLDQNSGFYVVSRYEDVSALLSDKRLSADRYSALSSKASPEEKEMNEEIIRWLSMFMLNLEGEKHGRLRALINKSFSPKLIQGLAPLADSVCHELVDKIKERGSFEVIMDLAFPMPVRFIAQMLGLEDVDVSLLKRLSDQLSVYIGSAGQAAGCIKPAHDGLLEMAELFWPIVRERKRQPKDDLVSALLEARIGDDRLSDEEVVSNCILFLVSGFETTTNLIAAGLLALLEHPEQMGRLRESPELMSDAVEEMLRFYPPVNRTARVLVEDVSLHGVTLKKGDFVILMMGAANRDPSVYERPDEFLIERKRDVRHLSFGAGIHFCIGWRLAKLEAMSAFQKLLGAFPRLEADLSEVTFRGGSRFRGIESLEVRV